MKIRHMEKRRRGRKGTNEGRLRWTLRPVGWGKNDGRGAFVNAPGGQKGEKGRSPGRALISGAMEEKEAALSFSCAKECS